MFWLLLLCHFLGDYPLQTDGMIAAKKKLSGLAYHVAIHFIVTLLALSAVLSMSWPQSIAIASALSLCHLAIDYWKNILTKLRPKWVLFGYIQDQLLHFCSILLITWLINQQHWADAIVLDHALIVYAIAFILVSHFWFITERVGRYQLGFELGPMKQMMWQRMMSRVCLYSLIFFDSVSAGSLVIIGAVMISWRDLNIESKKSAYLIDFSVVGAVILLTLIALG